MVGPVGRAKPAVYVTPGDVLNDQVGSMLS
jgi:hypothetical protein